MLRRPNASIKFRHSIRVFLFVLFIICIAHVRCTLFTGNIVSSVTRLCLTYVSPTMILAEESVLLRLCRVRSEQAGQTGATESIVCFPDLQPKLNCHIQLDHCHLQRITGLQRLFWIRCGHNIVKHTSNGGVYEYVVWISPCTWDVTFPVLTKHVSWFGYWQIDVSSNMGSDLPAWINHRSHLGRAR